MKASPRIRSCLALVLLLGLCARASAEIPGYAIVLAGGLRVRTQADVGAQIVGSLEEGDTVELLGRSPETSTIGGATDYWYQVRKDRLEGWAFGRYLSRDVHSYEGSSIVVYSGTSLVDPLRSYYHAFSLLQDRSFSTYEEGTRFSGSGSYYLVSGRQDSVGRLRVLDTMSGRVIVEQLFGGADPEWLHDDLSYTCVTGETGEESRKGQRVEIRDGWLAGSGTAPAGGSGARGDGSWERRRIYQSPLPGETLCHPRAWQGRDTTWFVAMGTREEGGEHVATLYEIREDLGAREIDRFPAAVNVLREAYTVPPEGGLHWRPYVWRQSDNFVLDRGLLCYYREPADPAEEPRYFVYELGGTLPPVEVPRARFEEVRTAYNLDTFQHVSLAPDGLSIAFTDMYDIQIRPFSGDFRDLSERRVSGFDLPLVEEQLTVMSLFSDPEIELAGGVLLIGALSWSADSRSLFFDNSGLDYRCIWRLDVAARSVTKIVPEHDAIHPFSYEKHDSSCVAYVIGGALMVATAPGRDSRGKR